MVPLNINRLNKVLYSFHTFRWYYQKVHTFNLLPSANVYLSEKVTKYTLVTMCAYRTFNYTIFTVFWTQSITPTHFCVRRFHLLAVKPLIIHTCTLSLMAYFKYNILTAGVRISQLVLSAAILNQWSLNDYKSMYKKTAELTPHCLCCSPLPDGKPKLVSSCNRKH